MPLRRVSTVLVAALLVLTASPSTAEELIVQDPVGDAYARGMDVTAATFDIGARRIRVTLDIERLRRGSVNAGLRTDQHDPRTVTVIRSTWRGPGTSPSIRVWNLYAGSPETVGRARCGNAMRRWDFKTDQVVLTVPARCVVDGDFSRARAWALTEYNGFGDADHVPGDDWSSGTYTRWIARG